MKSKKAASLAVLFFSLIILVSSLTLPASAAKSISKAVISVSSSVTYTGKYVKPSVKVKLSGKTLSTKYYTVSYKNNKNIGTATVTVTGKNGYSGKVSKKFKIVPAKVSNVKATPTSSSVKLSWNKVAGATHYQVYMYSNGSWVRKATTKSLSAEIKSLSGGTTYSFRVRAYKKVGSTYYIGSFCSTVKATTKLASPASFKATPAENSVTLTWAKVSKANYYQVWMHDGEGWSAVNTSKTKYTFSNLESGKTYTFRVRAYIKSGSSRTYGEYSSKLKSTTLISPVTSLKTSEITETACTISWKAAKGADSYEVKITDENGDETKKYTTTSTSYSFTGLHTSFGYKVTVRAYQKASKAYSDYAVLYFATSPQKLKDISVSGIGETSATVTWGEQSAVDGYVVYLLTLDKDGNVISRDKLSATYNNTYKTDTLEGTSKYQFRLYAYRKYNSKNYYSTPADSEVFTTLPSKVKSLKAIAGKDTITLSWDLQTGADGYVVYDSDKKEIKSLTPDKNLYTIYSLEEGKSYTFYVRSYINESGGTKNYSDYAAITATAGGPKVTGITFTKKTTSMTAGSTFATAIKIEPEDAANKKVTYTSAYPQYATIDANGIITAVKDGVTKITVTTEDGHFEDSFTLRVEKIKSTAISVPSSYEAYVGESVTIKPTFTPSNASDKTFTIKGSDYTYEYKGFLGSTKKDTCSFSDYFFIDNTMGRLVAKKATIEPETGDAFSFTVTVTANDSGAKDTFKISAAKRTIAISYSGDDNPWYYGNTVKLTATVDSNAGFTVDKLIWTSSNTSVAKVSSNGTVSCVGTGEVAIKATSPDGKQSHSMTVYVREIIELQRSYFESCSVGQSYQLQARTMPSGSASGIIYLSSDPSVAEVSSSGKVTIKKNGYAYVYISTGQTDTVTAVLTTGKCTLPSGNKMQLLSVMEASANKIKTAMPALYTSSLPTFSNVTIVKEGNFKTEDLVDIFESFASSQTRYIQAVNFTNYPNSTDYSNAQKSYLTSVPVSGQNFTIIPGLEESDIKDIQVIDSDSYTYDIKLTLKDEYMAAPPTKPLETAHGKIFDVLESKYMTMIQEGLTSGSSVSTTLDYSAFTQNYNNSSLTISYNKVTGEITNMKYDMNVHIEVVDLKIAMSLITAIDSTVRFDVNNVVNIEVRY